MMDRQAAMEDTASVSQHSTHTPTNQQQLMMQTMGGANAAMQQQHQQTSVLNNFDFTAIEELDPSLGKWPSTRIHRGAPCPIAQGHVVMFDREAPFELRIQEPGQGPQEVGTLEAIRIKVLI